ncbi:MAG: 4Fe-4S dicluster domain-containing protein [Hyphomicrobiales bacterium]
MKKDKTPNKEDNINDDSRRGFLRKGLAIGIGVIAGGVAINEGIQFEKRKEEALALRKGQRLKIITAEGKEKIIEPESLKPVSTKAEKAYLQKRGRIGIPGRKWVMVIDLSKCRNARMCMAACQTAHELRPEQHHINVLRMQDAQDTAPYFMPKPCYHCDNPPCVKVCPVDATWKRDDGIVLIDNERCIGCRICIAACPYSARTFNWFEPKNAKQYELEDIPYDVELNVPQKKGTISKCLFSADRLREGKLPYCVSACPNGVYWFGDMNEDAVTNGTTKETTKFSELIKKNAGYTMLPELGTKPSVYYLPPKNRLFPYNYKEELS